MKVINHADDGDDDDDDDDDDDYDNGGHDERVDGDIRFRC